MAEHDNDFDLAELVQSIKPSVVTPQLAQIAAKKTPEMKLKTIAKLIVKALANDYNNDPTYKTPKMIIHDHQSVAIRFLDVEPLLTGVWPAMSLCLLSLSYGEQTSLIEALYPKTTQLAAKAFAAIFTKEVVIDQKHQPLKVQETDDVLDRLDGANAGIAIIMAMMTKYGYRLPDQDTVNANLNLMDDLVQQAKDREQFKTADRKKEQARHHQDDQQKNGGPTQ